MLTTPSNLRTVQLAHGLSMRLIHMKDRAIYLLSIADIGPMQGFASCTLGRWTLSFFTVCSRIGLTMVDAPLTAMVADCGAQRHLDRNVIR